MVEIHAVDGTDIELERLITAPTSTWNQYFRQLLDVAIDRDTLFVGTTADGEGRINVYNTPKPPRNRACLIRSVACR